MLDNIILIWLIVELDKPLRGEDCTQVTQRTMSVFSYQTH